MPLVLLLARRVLVVVELLHIFDFLFVILLDEVEVI